LRYRIFLKLIYVTAALLVFLLPTVLSADSERTILTLHTSEGIIEYNEPRVTLIINGEVVEYFGGDMPPILLHGRTFLPLRDAFRLLGATVTWDDWLDMATVEFGGTRIALRDGSPFMNVDDGFLVALDNPAKTINGRMMVPVRCVARQLGFIVDWIDETRTVVLYSGHLLTQQNIEPGWPPVDQQDWISQNGSRDGHLYDIGLGGNGGSLIPGHIDLAVDINPGPLPVMNFGPTGIIDLEFDPNNPRSFYIVATSPISRVERFLLPDNRLVIDIFNAENMIGGFERHIGMSFLRSVRGAQHDVEPELITRFVFDLAEPLSYSVAFTEDRTAIVVTLLQNEISGVDFWSDGFSDLIYIHGHIAPVVNIFPQMVPDVFIIDIPLGLVRVPLNFDVNGNFATGVRATQLNAGTARVSIDIREQAAYDVIFDGYTTIIRLRRPTHQNLYYDSYTSTLRIPKTSGLNLPISAIMQVENYVNFEHIFFLPGDFSWYFGDGSLVVRDRFINHIDVVTEGGVTSLRFHQNRIMAFRVWEDANNIFIQAVLPRDVFGRIVVIDPGHGGRQPGTLQFPGGPPFGLIEAHVALDIAQRVAAILEAQGLRVYMTRHADVTVSLDSRVDFANNLGADLFVSIHLNGFYSAHVRGTETYFWMNEGDPRTGLNSERAAEIIQRNLISTLGTVDRGIKSHHYRVLVYTNMPAVLIEYAFITNPQDAALIATDAFRQQAAEATARGILEIFNTYPARR